MTYRVWSGGNSGTWSSAGNWNPQGVPTSGDVAVISSGGAVVSGLTLDALTILLGTVAQSASGGVLSAANVTFTSSTEIVVAAGGVATLALSGTVVNAGTIVDSGFNTSMVQSGPLDNAGSIVVRDGATYLLAGKLNTGTTVVVNGGTLVVQNAGILSGSRGAGQPATVDVENGGTVRVFGQVASGQSLAFTDGTGELDLPSPTGFHGSITAMQAGDVIDLPNANATSAVVSGGFITVSGITASGTTGIVAQIATTLPDNALQFSTRDVGFGTLLLTSDQTRTWTSTSGNWTNAANWTTSGVAGAGAPLAGDELFIDSGTATLDATAGVVNASLIHLDGKSFFSPGTLLLQSATLGATTTILVDGQAKAGQIEVSGTDVVDGTVSAASINGFLVVDGADPAGAASDVIVVNGAVVAAAGAGVAFTSVTVENNGLIDVYGGMYFDSSAPLMGSSAGVVEISNGGTVSFGGTVDSSQQIDFGDTQGELQIADPAGFGARISNFQQGDVIDLVGLSGASVSYLAAQSELVVSAGGHVYTLDVALDTTTTNSIPQFVASADGSGGTAISYKATDPITVDLSMPVAVVGTATQMVSFDQILTSAFGTDQLPFAPSTEFTFTAQGNRVVNGGIQNSYPYGFWGQPQQTPSATGIYPSWYLNGVSSTQFTATLAQIQSGAVMFEVGNSIVSTAAFSVADPNGQQITTYHMLSVDPGASTASSGVTPTSSTERASIARFDQFYSYTGPIVSSAGLPTVINDNDCPWIGDDIAAGGGATMPWQDESTDPNANEEGGFWRIVYNGATSGSTVGNGWYQYLQAGDVVRMGWAGINSYGTAAGQHTTSILDVLPTSGTSATAISVWDDNDYIKSTSYIGQHDATYWDSTVPQTITIYRIDPNGQYLIQGHTSGETILGNDFNDLIRPVGGGAIIHTGTGATEVQGAGADLAGSTVTSFNAGDTFDVTDLANASVTYRRGDGTLTIGTGTNATVLNLTAQLPGTFMAASDGADGTMVSYVACYGPGTLIATPGGECPVEQLRIGDEVVTLNGQVRPIRWIGRRSYAGRFLAANPGVHPVRFGAGSLGDGLPRRDLLVSPEHAMFLDGILVPARCLVNGASIVHEHGLDRVDYTHIELDSHDVLLAEGAPSESFMDDNSRKMFHNAAEYGALYPDAPPPGQFCAPRKEDGPLLDAVRRRLAGLSRKLADAA